MPKACSTAEDSFEIWLLWKHRVAWKKKPCQIQGTFPIAQTVCARRRCRGCVWLKNFVAMYFAKINESWETSDTLWLYKRSRKSCCFRAMGFVLCSIAILSCSMQQDVKCVWKQSGVSKDTPQRPSISVGRALDSYSNGRGFEPHVGRTFGDNSSFHENDATAECG